MPPTTRTWGFRSAEAESLELSLEPELSDLLPHLFHFSLQIVKAIHTIKKKGGQIGSKTGQLSDITKDPGSVSQLQPHYHVAFTLMIIR